MQHELNPLIVDLEEVIEASGVGANIGGLLCDVVKLAVYLIDLPDA